MTLFENNESQISLLPISETTFLKKDLSKIDNGLRFHEVAVKAGILKTKTDFEGILFELIWLQHAVDSDTCHKKEGKEENRKLNFLGNLCM